MSSPTPIAVTERDNTLNPRQLRAAGFTPATLYGKNIESRSIQVKTKDFVTTYAKGNREYRFEGIDYNGNPIVAKAHKLQVTSVKDELISIEFLQISPAGPETVKKPARNSSQGAGKPASAKKASAKKAAVPA